jgi:hypothetical protein
MKKTVNKKLSVSVGDAVRSKVHNLDGLVLGLMVANKSCAPLLFKVELENGEKKHFTPEQLDIK